MDDLQKRYLIGLREGAVHFVTRYSDESSPSVEPPKTKPISEGARKEWAVRTVDLFDKLDHIMGKNITVLELRQAIDQFFEEPANRPIPLIGAFSVVIRKFAGATPHDIEEMTLVQRKLAQQQH